MSDPVEAAVAAVLAGELIVLPTDTVYGMGTRPDDPAATARLFVAKGRPRELEVPVLAASREDAERIAVFDDRAAALADRYWPGGLTMVLPRAAASAEWDLGGDRATVGVRIPDHRLALAVLSGTGPLAVTSANRSGQPTPASCDEIKEVFDDAVRVYLCQSNPPPGIASTVVDVTADVVRVLRQGGVAFAPEGRPGEGASGADARLRAIPMARILVVCTGNICRSPMAEAFLRRSLVERLGDAAPTVRSAGVIGRQGEPAMDESVRAAAERGVDISTHVVTRLDPALVADVDLVVTMAGEHRDEIVRATPAHANKTFTLKELVRLLEHLPPDDRAFDLRAAVGRANALRDAGFVGRADDEDIVDPLGMSLETYRAVALELDEWCDRLAAGLAGRARTRAGAGGEAG